MSIDFALGQFEPLIWQAFTIDVGSDGVSAVLIEANNLREAQGIGHLSRQFSLVWRGPRDVRLEQRIYSVRHPALPPLDLFLVCIGPDAEGMRYEAVFT